MTNVAHFMTDARMNWYRLDSFPGRASLTPVQSSGTKKPKFELMERKEEMAGFPLLKTSPVCYDLTSSVVS